MRPLLCTVSVFVVIVSALIATIFIRMPYYAWWDHSESAKWMLAHGETLPLIVWIIFNGILPLLALAGLGAILTGIWFWCAVICGKLMGKS